MEKYWEKSDSKKKVKARTARIDIGDKLIYKGIQANLRIEKLRMESRKSEIETLREKPEINQYSEEILRLKKLREETEQFDTTPRRFFELLDSSVDLRQAKSYKRILENRKRLICS